MPTDSPTRPFGDTGGLSRIEVGARSDPTQEEAVGFIWVERSRIGRAGTCTSLATALALRVPMLSTRSISPVTTSTGMCREHTLPL